MNEVKLAIGNNHIKQLQSLPSTELISTETVIKSWDRVMSYTTAHNGCPGLRPAQLGALFAIKSHWTVSNESATIVMPTGTGKTETMIATIVSESIDHALIIVPSSLLRKQIAKKMLTFGILQTIDIIHPNALKPSVTALLKTPKTLFDLREIFEKSNIVITTMSLLQRFPAEYLSAINNICHTMIVDEAHHIPASSWTRTKHQLNNLKCLQFTATPFRNDGKKLDGQIIYNFPLSLAQKQNYFQKINFSPIFEFDEEQADVSIANAAIEQLEKDLSSGYNHLVLVRAKNKNAANYLYNKIYRPNFSHYNPVLVHSDIPPRDRDAALSALRHSRSRIVVCVDMFGEGIDIPALKIAAIHHRYKSLPITLQFIGRFARTDSGLGTATLITNIADDELNETLQELYRQDSDWNTLLHTLSNTEIGKQLSLQELANGFDCHALQGIPVQQIKPKISMIAYRTEGKNWNPHSISNKFDAESTLITINHDRKIIIIIEKLDTKVDRSSFKGINNTNWDLHLAYWNPISNMLFINSTNKSISDSIANTLFLKSHKVYGEETFRCLYGIKQLLLGTIGLKSGIDGPIRFKMFAGIDIRDGITESQKETSFKSNLFGTGYNNNRKVSIGCSYKGRIWEKWVESIDYWTNWCDNIAIKLQDESINTDEILQGALIPKIISERPHSIPYSIEWPIDLDLAYGNKFQIETSLCTYYIYELEIKLLTYEETGPLRFSIGNNDLYEEYELHLSENGFSFSVIKSYGFILKKPSRQYRIIDFLKDFPPRIKFTDLSLLEGNLLVQLPTQPPVFPSNHLITWNWSSVDIKQESQGPFRNKKSIQYYVIEQLKSHGNSCVIFDDDGSGEIADIINIIECNEQIVIEFYHCKYAHGDKPGARVADLYEVCGQAEKSIKWCHKPKEIIDRLIARETLRKNKYSSTRFEIGSIRKLKEIKNKISFFPVKFKIFIVQPGIDPQQITNDMLRILSGSSSYLMDTYGIQLQVITS